MTIGDDKEEARFIAELAVRIYERHVHNAAPYMPFDVAMKCAAAVYGAAQSDKVADFIAEAKNAPLECLQQLSCSLYDVNQRVQADRKRHMAHFKESMSDKESFQGVSGGESPPSSTS